LQKSKRQKNIAWGLLAGGTTFTVVGGAIAAKNIEVCAFGDCEKSNEWDEGSIIGTIGLAAMVASVPMFISAGNNKRKAAAMTFEYRPLQLDPVFVRYNREHALVFRIALE
ncbi:MAG: hypothetical protein KJP00_06425, partial [Bacteroidia bacterium]|nr:hypothetical protein [Bacteroidia bacterium]